MVQQLFARHVVSLIQNDPEVLGIAAAGSWIGNNLDEFSDLDLVVVTKEKISDDKNRMISFAQRFGHLLSSFTGEHVSEPRLLICLYADPFLHVDFKFLTANEFNVMIEKPMILFDRNGLLEKILESASPQWPFRGYQWMEDRFWVWIHYMVQKLERGEYFEVHDGLATLRNLVLAPLIRIRNRQLPKGVRKIEMEVIPADLDNLKLTLSEYDAAPLLAAISNSASLYTSLRRELYDSTVELRKEAEERVMNYVNGVSSRFIDDGGR